MEEYATEFPKDDLHLLDLGEKPPENIKQWMRLTIAQDAKTKEWLGFYFYEIGGVTECDAHGTMSLNAKSIPDVLRDVAQNIENDLKNN